MAAVDRKVIEHRCLVREPARHQCQQIISFRRSVEPVQTLRVVNPTSRFVRFQLRDCPSNFKAGIPPLRHRIHAPTNLRHVRMSAEWRWECLQLLVGFDVAAELEAADGCMQMKNVWRFERLYQESPQYDFRKILNFPMFRISKAVTEP